MKTFVEAATPAGRAADRAGPLNPRLRDWNARRVWIVGASSGIGESLARELSARGARLALSARREAPLVELARVLPGEHHALPIDVCNPDHVARACETLVAKWGDIDLVIWLAGDYSPMRADNFDLGEARRLIDINLTSVYNGLAALLPVFSRQRAGGIALVASVAGYRGLPKALAYGPGKAGLINLAESLYLDLSPQGIGVWLIDPGFVATPLTAQNAFHMPGLISAEEAAQQIIAGFATGGFEIHFPKRFTLWMKALRLLPARWYFRAIRAVTGG